MFFVYTRCGPIVGGFKRSPSENRVRGGDVLVNGGCTLATWSCCHLFRKEVARSVGHSWLKFLFLGSFAQSRNIEHFVDLTSRPCFDNKAQGAPRFHRSGFVTSNRFKWLEPVVATYLSTRNRGLGSHGCSMCKSPGGGV